MSQHFDFAEAFKALTGNAPLSWQRRLFEDHFVKNDLPSVIDLPTGLGKTMVMAIWLIAWAQNKALPRRLIYVVDRRTVVDQATDLAEEFAYLLGENADEKFAHVVRRKPELVERKTKYESLLTQLRSGLDHAPAVSTLRGQLADNREWSADPSRPAIIIGTVDLIGSALLFSGYRSSFKRRPLEAGLLGQDSLLVLDEAHLSKPFEKLICEMDAKGRFQKDRAGKACGTPMRVIRMSATSMSSNDPFSLELDAEGNLAGEDARDQTVVDRFHAKKRLSIEPVADVHTAIRDAVCDGLLKSRPGERIVIFAKSPKAVEAIQKALVKKDKALEPNIAVLTGTMRGLERDEMLERPQDGSNERIDQIRRVMQRFLHPINDPSLGPAILISTSAGEVGFDLNADHMLCDAAPLDSLIQRLGRVNRRGHGTAIVRIFVEQASGKEQKKGESPSGRRTVESASLEAVGALRELPVLESVEDDNRPQPIYDASPRALRNLAKPDDALSPDPTMVELTDILLDAWSMTSIREPMPGRPEVGPWLRGIDNEQAQTTIAWRAELELFHDEPNPEKALRAIFNKHPIRPHESLTVNTGYLLEFLKRIPKLNDRPPNLMATRVAIRLPRGQVVCHSLQQLAVEPGILYADSTLILPARFGGLDNSGMLDAESIPKKRKDDEPEPPSRDEADRPRYEQREEAESRLRVRIRRNESDQWTADAVPGGVALPDRLDLKSSYDRSANLVNALTSGELRLRLVQPVKFDDEGDPTESLILLSPVSSKGKPEDQSLSDHVGAVEEWAKRIADALGLVEHDPVRIALLFAAKWHDEGKKAAIWRTYANGPMPDGRLKGKSRKYRDPKSLNRTRHELESLLRIAYPANCDIENCVLPADPDARDLALHLIAVHHGFGRPHFPAAFYRGFTTDEYEAVHTEAIRRFARLQRKYGWWYLAWLENLLRCADAMASADQEAEDDSTELEGEE